MATPVEFPSTTPHFSLPLLSVGQAQKEFFINQALSIADALLQGAVDGSATSPPTEPEMGSCYRIMENAGAEWAGHDDQIALWIGEAWTFISPKPGMQLFDRASGSYLFYLASWQAAEQIASPTGGETVDAQARGAIAELITALRSVGILPQLT